MPIGAFTQCLAGDLTKVSKGKYYSDKKLKPKWTKLFDQHIKLHGLPESYVWYVAKMKKALKLYKEAYTGKPWQIAKARICEAEAELLLAGEGERIELTCARLSKFMGIRIKADECSVSEFYGYVSLMNNI